MNSGADWASWFESTLRGELPDLPESEPLDPDRPLVLYGLDSFGWAVLAAKLEEWVTLPDELLLPSSFRSARTLWNAVLEAFELAGRMP